jgi:hypothetical protein
LSDLNPWRNSASRFAAGKRCELIFAEKRHPLGVANDLRILPLNG